MTALFITLVFCCALFRMVPPVEMEQMESLAAPQALWCSLGRPLFRDTEGKGFYFLILPSFASQACLATTAWQSDIGVVSAAAAVAATIPSELMFIVSVRASLMGVLTTGITSTGLSLCNVALKSLARPRVPAEGVTLPYTIRYGRPALLFRWFLERKSSWQMHLGLGNADNKVTLQQCSSPVPRAPLVTRSARGRSVWLGPIDHRTVQEMWSRGVPRLRIGLVKLDTGMLNSHTSRSCLWLLRCQELEEFTTDLRMLYLSSHHPRQDGEKAQYFEVDEVFISFLTASAWIWGRLIF